MLSIESLWYPYTQMKDKAPSLKVKRTNDTLIELEDGRVLIDAIASWWTACHGYQHPHLVQAMRNQLETMSHVMLGGLTHDPALLLAQKLSHLLPNPLNHVFFTDSGSVAVEAALKMVLQYWINQGKPSRHHFIHFKDAYHGDTFFAMSVCDPEEGMHHLFKDRLPKQFLQDIPKDEHHLKAYESFLNQNHEKIAGLIIEPLVQRAGGMKFHSPDMLNELIRLTQSYDLPVIFDEIFTGFGRTGSLFAFNQCEVIPDIICLGKGLTGGMTPLAATVASSKIFEAFYSNEPNKTFMHGPTFTGHALGCQAALASLELFETEPRLEQARAIESFLKESVMPLRRYPCVKEVRVKGAIGVIQVQKAFSLDLLKILNQHFVQNNIWLRPFGDILYLTPALTISPEPLQKIVETMESALALLDT